MNYRLVTAWRDPETGRVDFFKTNSEQGRIPFEQTMTTLGYRVTGHCDAERFSDGQERRTKLRPELHGQPIFDGLLGPMWDGDAVRYENPTANDILST